MTQAQFVDAFAISRMSPGPGSLLAIFGPTAFLIYGVAHLWSRYNGARWQIALETGLRPVAAGMILAAVYVLLLALDGGWLTRVMAVAATVVLMMTRVNPMLLITIGAFAALSTMIG